MHLLTQTQIHKCVHDNDDGGDDQKSWIQIKKANEKKREEDDRARAMSMRKTIGHAE